MTILITGGHGQLGQALMASHRTLNTDVIAVNHQEGDITDPTAIHALFARYRPQCVINAAAYTAVDNAEKDHSAAFNINVMGPTLLAQACQAQKIPLLHFSTDYIFAGDQTTPYQETDHVQPQSYYGLTKWQGEQAVRAHCEHHLVLRLSGVYSAYQQNFVKTIFNLLFKLPKLQVVADQITGPTAANDIAQTVWALVANLLSTNPHYGTYHYASTPSVSWYDFAEEIKRYTSERCVISTEVIEAITTQQFGRPAARPAYSVFDCRKIQQDFAITLPDVWQSLHRVLDQLIAHSQG